MTYGCNSTSQRKPKTGPRGQQTTSWMQDGYMQVEEADGSAIRVAKMVEVTTDWLPMRCGKLAQAGMGADPKCAGCENGSEK